MPTSGTLINVMGTITTNNDPSLVDMQNYLKYIMHVLSSYHSHVTRGKHTWLIEIKLEYKKRIGHEDKIMDNNGDMVDNLFQLLDHPEQPILPNTSSSTVQPKMAYIHHLCHYETADHCNSTTIMVICKNFYIYWTNIYGTTIQHITNRLGSTSCPNLYQS